MEYQVPHVRSWKGMKAEDESPRRPVLHTRASTTNLTGSLMRLGKVRVNRSAVLPEVNKRLQSFDKEYRKLLECICNNLAVPKSFITTALSPPIGPGVADLIKSGSVDVDKYLHVFPDNTRYTLGANGPILRTVLEVSKSLQQFSLQQNTPALSILKCLHVVVARLEACPHLPFDCHASQVISWWFPQFIELLSIVLLLSEPSSEGGQMLKDTNTVESFFNCYRANVVIVVYLLSGAYMVDLNLTQCLTDIKVNPKEKERDCDAQLEEMTAQMTKHVRVRLQAPTEESLLGRGPPALAKKPRKGRPLGSFIRCWRDIYDTLPPVCSTAVYLFLLDVPQDICAHLNMDVLTQRLQKGFEVVQPLHLLLDRIHGIGVILESLRGLWPVTFSSDGSDFKMIARTAMVLMAETERLGKLRSVPFAVPESWEAWKSYVALLRVSVMHIALLGQRKAARHEAEHVFGKVIVQTRFMNQLSKVEASEACILSII